MSRKVNVVQRDNGQTLLEEVRWCSSYGCKLLGFQFRRRLKSEEALILVYNQDSVRSTSIHMFFVFTSLTAVWVNRQGRVTSVQLAQPWRPYYASPEPASYVLETGPELFELFHPGDEVDFINHQ